MYIQDIQKASASLTIAAPPALENTFDMKASSASFVVNPTNAEAYYYPEDTYSSATTMQFVLKVCLIGALATVVLSFRFWVLAGIELVHVVQIAFLACSLVESLPPVLAPASELWLSLGYNKFFTDFSGLLDFQSPELPKTLTQMEMGPRFVQNCNYMIAGQVVVVIVGVFIYLLSLMMKNYSESLLKTAKFVLN